MLHSLSGSVLGLNAEVLHSLSGSLLGLNAEVLHSLSGSVLAPCGMIKVFLNLNLGLNAEVEFDASQPVRVSFGSER